MCFPASTLGYAKGVAAGMAPKAILAAYKVCWNVGCFDSDILAAFDAAVADGVDVISLSVGGVVGPYHLDAIAIGAFSAADMGIFVSASAGNGGPGGLTVTNVAPWVATIGAGTIDRDFPAEVKLGNGKVLPGVSTMGRLYFGGINSRAAKGEVVKKAGGIGMILANGAFDGEGLVADCHVLPATSVGASNGDEIRGYIDSASKSKSPATATIVFKGKIGVQPAPVVASFSARGPNPQPPEILNRT
ncbi:Subtilisin-like protease SBT1.6 [Hibiscus syriacus]|uniref:Subtilisin-like protease SBT1.6 n=1 Tax=Hibiscus syriacus TaxID=106335 RepID=A0A6A3BWX1_HIBSY|nr:Subtilisin-like protease SBT1.6 [Hibiscus syriacus]